MLRSLRMVHKKILNDLLFVFMFLREHYKIQLKQHTVSIKKYLYDYVIVFYGICKEQIAIFLENSKVSTLYLVFSCNSYK